jgi:hypothetical protein
MAAVELGSHQAARLMEADSQVAALALAAA